MTLKIKHISSRFLYFFILVLTCVAATSQTPAIPIKLSAVHGRFPLDSIMQANEWEQETDKTVITNFDLAQRSRQYSLRFHLFNDYQKDTTFYLRNCNNGSTFLLLKDSSGKLLSTEKTGYYVPISQRFGHDEQGFLPLRVPKATEVTVHVIVDGFNGSRPDLSSTIYDSEAYYKFYRDQMITANTQEYITVCFLGAIFMIMVFFLFMYFKSRQALYGRYAFYQSMHFIYGVLRTGPNSLIGAFTLEAPFLKASLISPIILVAVAGYAWFLNELLDLKHQRLKLYRQLRWTAIILWIYSFADWILYYSVPNLPFHAISFFIVRIVLVLINVYILVSVAFFVKSSIKKYYIVGNSLFLVFGVVAGFKEINTIFANTYLARLNNANWYMIGILLECIFFAFALGIRIKELQQEKEDTTRKLIAQMQLHEQMMRETNLALEQKVNERTAKILLQEKQIEQVKLQETRAAYEKQLSESRMQALRSRMNPHFLFNSLNSIKYFILKDDNDTAAFYLNKFSKLLRHILEYSNHETITLQQELDTLKLYLEIESLRFDQSFHYHVNVSEEISPDQIHIPPLILQPFVENAIWHGLANSDKPDKFCIVDVAKQNGQVIIIIRDNGVGRNAAAAIKENKLSMLKTESYGLRITEERISIFNNGSNDKLRIAVEDDEDEFNQPAGTTIRITLQNLSS